MSAPSVLSFPVSAVEVVGSLRRVADQIEAGQHGMVRFAGLVLCIGGKDVTVYSFGNHTMLEVSGAFLKAATVAGQCSELIETTEPNETA